MSSLLQNVLASRLAQATLGSEGSSNSNNDASTSQKGQAGSMAPPPVPSSSQALEEWENVESSGIPSDEELVGVMSAPGTVPGTPHISRPSSPGLTGKARRSALGQATLLPSDSGPINKRYRRSATLNYCWYRQCHSSDMQDGFAPTTPSGGAKWTRRESKIDWKSQYAKQKRLEAREAQRLESLPGSGTTTPSRTQRLRDEGIKTPREMREEEWSQQDSVGFTKGEMREWYKSQGGTKGGKLKGKTGKGGLKTGAAGDGSLWE